jgi:hypothetical protein
MYSKIIFVVLFILRLGSVTAYCQNIYFDKAYDSGLSDNQNEAVWGNSTFELNDGYMAISFTKDNVTNATGMWVIRTDLFGDTLWTINHVDTNYQEFHNSAVKHFDNNYVSASTAIKLNTANPEQEGDACLTKITPNGDVIWKKYYGSDTLYEVGQTVITTDDSGFAVIGQRTLNFQNNADVYFVKTDSAGNQLWEKTYGGTDFDGGFSAVQTIDEGFLILGWTRSYGNGERDFYLIKTDSLGNQDWQNTYGGNDMETGIDIIALVDGNYLLIGAKVLSGLDRGWLIKIDPDGEIIWQKTYIHNGNTANEFYNGKELNNGDLALVGGTHDNDDNGWLVKTDSTGNILWQRKYNPTNDVDLLYALLPVSDSGFLLSGQTWNNSAHNQEGWLIKVDSIGCPYPNCTVGIEEEGKKVLVDVYPNPANEVLNLELQETGKAFEVELTDINGHVIYKSEIRNQKSEVSVSGYANGIYLLTLQNEEQRTSLKIVIQH